MSGFKPIVVTYSGEEKTIPADNFLIILAEIEEHIAFNELNSFLVAASTNKAVKMAKIISAFHRLLELSGFTPPPQAVLSRQILNGESTSDAVSSLTNLFKQLHNSEDEEPEKKDEKKPRKRVVAN